MKIIKKVTTNSKLSQNVMKQSLFHLMNSIKLKWQGIKMESMTE